MKSSANHHRSAQDLAFTALFTAIILLMAFTPLGLIDLPIIKATILHVPVIIGAVLLGPKKGAFFGFLFGLTSLIKNTMAPSLLSFAFSPFVPLPGSSSGSLWALVICFIPRVLVGVVPYYAAIGLQKLLGRKAVARTVSYAAAGVCGAVVNTGLVMGTMGLVLSNAFAAAQGISHDLVSGALLAIVFANGIPETIAAAVLTPVVCLAATKALGLYQEKKGSKGDAA